MCLCRYRHVATCTHAVPVGSRAYFPWHVCCRRDGAPRAAARGVLFMWSRAGRGWSLGRLAYLSCVKAMDAGNGVLLGLRTRGGE